MTRHASRAVSSGPALSRRGGRSHCPPLQFQNPQSEGSLGQQPSSTVSQGSTKFPAVHRAHHLSGKGRSVAQPGYAVDRAPSPLIRNASRGLTASSPIANHRLARQVRSQTVRAQRRGICRFGQRGENRRRRCGRARHKTNDLQSAGVHSGRSGSHGPGPPSRMAMACHSNRSQRLGASAPRGVRG